jgi:hypothetical protein
MTPVRSSLFSQNHYLLSRIPKEFYQFALSNARIITVQLLLELRIGKKRVRYFYIKEDQNVALGYSFSVFLPQTLRYRMNKGEANER